MTAKKKDLKWKTLHKEMTKEAVKLSFQNNLEYALAKDEYTVTQYDAFLAAALSVRERLVERWILTQQRYHKKNLKRVYYLSMEFLLGRLLGSSIINLDLWEQTKAALEEMGLDLDELRDCEFDAGLGNGGLGRLAACFLDSMATLGIPAHGYGIRYEYGIFNQKIVDGAQVERPDTWLSHDNPWQFPRPEFSVKVRFYGRVHMVHDSGGKLRVSWEETDDVIAMPYDVPVPGYKNDIVNTLRLWSARSTEEFDFNYFNGGDYDRAVYDKVFSENISKVLYPNDNVLQGRELRLKQEYFFTAASLADILRRFKSENKELIFFPEKVAIQLNDTHPALAIPELMRLLLDEEKCGWETAWKITTETFAYTNHTIMPEALEAWNLPLFEKLLPRHLQIIFEINRRFLDEVSRRFPNDRDRLRRVSIIEEGEPQKIRMAYLAVVASHSVNGVSELHSNLLKTHLFKDFFEIFPDKFNNKTNGITQRRWLQKSNHRLSSLINEVIGEGWATDLSRLKLLKKYQKDAGFIKRWQEVKTANKKDLAAYIQKTTGVMVDPESLFDIQVKRIHEYKRPLLFAFYILSEYIKMKNHRTFPAVPRTFIFSGKAAPGYFMAKKIIRLICNMANLINHDPDVVGRMKVVFLENYRVSLAEKIFPASDLSEQISTAGTEASGTGCMKFMLNGALTIGTYDGANIEIAEEVGSENIFLFGLKAHEIQALHQSGYDPRAYAGRGLLKEVVELIQNHALSPAEFGLFQPVVDSLLYADPYFVCADFDAYCQTQHQVSELYKDKKEWTQKSILNVSAAGKFSSDRTIREYARHIWRVPAGEK